MTAVSLHSRKVVFAEAAERSEGDKRTAVVGLSFVATFAEGRTDTISAASFRSQGLARDVVKVMWEEAGGVGAIRSPSTAVNMLTALRAFDRFLADRGRQITRAADITCADIESFDAEINANSTTSTPFQQMSALRVFLRLAAKHDLTSESITPRLAYVSQFGMVEGVPRDSYSPYVAAQLRVAAEKGVEAAVLRITVEGMRLATEGQDPAIGGLGTPANVVWAIIHAADQIAFLAEHGLRARQQGQSASKLMSFVHPTEVDGVAFLVLMALATGLPIESLKELKADCLSNERDGRADLVYVKRRKGVVTEQRMPVRCEGRMSPGALIKTWLTVTSTTRKQMAEAERQWLFVGFRAQRRMLVRFQFDALGPARILKGNRDVFQAFLSQHDIKDDNGIPVISLAPSRLRKTHKAERYVEVNGHLADVADDHSKRVFAKHYATIPSLIPLHEQAVTDALHLAVAAALPIVMPPAEEKTWREDASRDPKRAEVFAGDADVWLADCLVPGSNCPNPVWGCLGCQNAVITSSKLPAILTLLGHLLELRGQMSLTTWGAKHAAMHRRITEQILPRFPSGEVALARAVAAADHDLLWLPIDMLTGG